jgi:hypothetical protein
MPKKTVTWSGSTDEAISWDNLVLIFDALIGSELHHLPKFPARIGATHISWKDADRNEHELSHLDDLRQPYEAQLTAEVTVSKRGDEQASLVYAPGAPRPRVQATLRAEPDKIADRMTPLAEAFPAPFEGAVIFLSWGGDSSFAIAEVLHRILVAHFPSADVFFSPVSIDIGDDPLVQMFENHLLQAQALVAVLTEESAKRPWVIREIATVWARRKLVAALFVDVAPGNVAGPLPLKVQGARITDRAKVDRALTRIANAIGVTETEPLSDEEWNDVMAVVAAAASGNQADSGRVNRLAAKIHQRLVPLDDGMHSGRMLGIEVSADEALDCCSATLTSITGPPGAVTILAPARLYWHPSREVSEDVVQGASTLVNLVRVGPDSPGAVIDSPDHRLPWTVPNGTWHVELQVTAKGFAVQRLAAAFIVRPSDDVMRQTVEWVEL